MKLFRLIYMSEKSPSLTLSEIVEMIEAGQARNQSRQLTGALCAQKGTFLQVLEGDSKWVSHLYKSISNDTRHSNVRLLSMRPVKNRLFAAYDMRFIHSDVLQEVGNLVNLDPHLNPDFSEELLDGFVHRLSDLFAKIPQ